MDKSFYKSKRVLFVISMCPHCREWMRFIGVLNAKLPLDKQIDVVEMTNYYDYGIIDNPLITAYKRYLTHTYPILFFEGIKLESSASKEELEAFANTLVGGETLIMEHNRFLFTKECEFKKTVLGKRLVCQ